MWWVPGGSKPPLQNWGFLATWHPGVADLKPPFLAIWHPGVAAQKPPTGRRGGGIMKNVGQELHMIVRRHYQSKLRFWFNIAHLPFLIAFTTPLWLSSRPHTFQQFPYTF